MDFCFFSHFFFIIIAVVVVAFTHLLLASPCFLVFLFLLLLDRFLFDNLQVLVRFYHKKPSCDVWASKFSRKQVDDKGEVDQRWIFFLPFRWTTIALVVARLTMNGRSVVGGEEKVSKLCSLIHSRSQSLFSAEETAAVIGVKRWRRRRKREVETS